MPRLWAFFCLSQILPISFTQNLFYLALSCLPQNDEHVAVAKNPIFVTLIAYSGSLVLATFSDLLLPSILTARVSLFAPLILGDSQLDLNKAETNVLDGWGLQEMLAGNTVHILAWWIYIFRRDKLSFKDIPLVSNKMVIHRAAIMKIK